MTWLPRTARLFIDMARSADLRPKPKPKPDPMAEVDAVLAQEPPRPEPLPPITHRRTSKAGIDLMHEFEGLHKVRRDGLVESYLCPAKVWTIGWGSTGADPFHGGMIRKGTVWTREQCDLRFEQHLAQFERGVRDGIGKAATSQAQFDAMCSLSYNIGVAAFQKSTLLRKHIAGDHAGAAKEFARWNRAGGRVMKGLVRRRAAEADLYRSGM